MEALEDRRTPSATPFGPIHGYDGSWDAASGTLLVNVAQADGTLAGNTLAISTVVDSGNTFVTLNGDQTAIKAAEVKSLTLSDIDLSGLTYDITAVRGSDFSALTAALAVNGLGDSTLKLNDTARLWTVYTVDGGSATGADYGIGFTGIDTIDAGKGADTFQFNDGDYLTGAIDGGTGAGNTLDFSQYTTVITANVTASDAGSMTVAGNVFKFANIQNLTGGTGANRYDFADGGSLTTLDGGSGGSNTLNFFDTALAPIAADITGASAGAVGAVVTFIDIQTLNGSSAGGDTYTIENGASIGAINGSAAGNNTLIYPASTSGAVTVNLQTQTATGLGSFSNIGTATVGETAHANTLTGADTPNDWDISGATAGVLNGGAFTFSGFNVLNAGQGGDDFTVDPAVTFAGAINGNGGIDTLLLGTASQTVSLSSDSDSGFTGSVATVSGGFSAIDLLVGTGSTNTLTGENSASNWNLDLAGVNQYVTNTHTLTFTNFQTLNGGSSGDIFTCYGDFSGTLNGGSGANTFAFVGSAVLTGNIVGNSGNDTLDYTNYDLPIVVVLSADYADGFSGADHAGSILGSFSNIDTLVGSGNDADSLTGENVTATWTLATPLYTYRNGADTLTFRNIDIVIGGAGADAFNVGSTLAANNGDLDNLARPLSIDGGGHPIGQPDSVYINDHGTIGKADYVITPTSVSTDPATTPRTFAGITYANIGSLRLDGTDAINVFNVTPSVGTAFYLNGNLPALVAMGDVLILDLTGVTGAQLALTSPGNGRYTFTNRQPVTFTSIESQTGRSNQSLPQGTARAVYHQTITVQNGVSPFISMTLSNFNGGRTGLTAAAITTNRIAGKVVIHGTALAAGTVTFNVNITDRTGATFTQSFTITFNPALAISNPTVTSGTFGKPGFLSTLTISGGTPAFHIVGIPTLPPGLTAMLSGNAIVVTGTPTANGLFFCSLTLQDAAGAMSTKTFTIIIVGPPLDLRRRRL